MRDIIIVIFLAACIIVTLRRPWLGVLSLAVFSYLSPHTYAWGFSRTMPVYLIMFCVAFFAFITSKDKQPIPKDWRIPTFFFLWFYFVITTLDAEMFHFAQQKLIEVSKIYLPFFLTLMLINTREKLYYLIAAIGGSIALIAAKGGIFAIATGFSYRVWGPPTTQFYGNNEFAIATLMAIPLLILWRRETENKYIRLGLTGVIPLCFASSISSWSRGALLTLFVLGLVLFWNSKRKFLIIPVIIGAVMVVPTVLPDGWFDRMSTIQTYDQDESAMSRIQAWTDGLNYVIHNPLTGAGFDGWRVVTYRDWHSSYVEILAEHGFIAFGLWLSLVWGTIFSLTNLIRQVKRYPELKWAINYATMVRASMIAYAVGTLFLGLSYWTIMYHLVFVAVLIRKFALEEIEVLKKDGTLDSDKTKAQPPKRPNYYPGR